MLDKLQNILFRGVNPITLGLFRIGFGIIMMVQFYHIQDYFFNLLVQSKYFVKYDFFEWVELTSVENLKIIFAIGILGSFFITIGFLYRVSSAIVFLLWCYLFFTDQGHNNNHYYLIGMFLFFLIFVNADQWGSIKGLKKNAELIPKWNYLVFKLLILILYFYGGIAKINNDWLNGYPLRYWLSGRDHLGPFFKELLEKDVTIYIFSYYGLLFDLVVGFLLFHKRLKYLALFLMIPFHISNHFLWPIGVFPWLSIFMTILFFENEINRFFKSAKFENKKFSNLNKRIVTYVFVVFFLLQILMPLRQFLYSGKTNWHGYGEFFAWRMMLTDKQGAVRLRVYSENDQYLGEVSLQEYINQRQLYKMIFIPKNFVPFCKFIEKEIKSDSRNSSLGDIKIFADVFKTINNRPFERVIDPNIDLTAVEYSILKRGSYILPYKDSEIDDNYNEITNEEFLRFIK